MRWIVVICIAKSACSFALPVPPRKTISVRGGGALQANPGLVYDALFGSLALAAVSAKVVTRQKKDPQLVAKEEEKNVLGLRFLPVFWLLRAADWLQGPYFYEVYASKTSPLVVPRLFLAGFGSTAICGPIVGRWVDRYGRKAGTLVFAVIYAMAALTTRSNDISILFLGRVLSGIGTALLFSAPEAWLVGEAKRTNREGSLGKTFGAAYGGDALVAIAAGQMASLAAYFRGPTGPFELSVAFLILGFITASFRWTENVAPKAERTSSSGIGEAFRVAVADPRILLVGAVQALFEGAMYVFVLQWPPAMTKAITSAFGSVGTPFGKIFSCFMVCCLLGSTFFSHLQSKHVAVEKSLASMTALASVAMAAATIATKYSLYPLAALTLAFFAFEFAVGVTFPVLQSTFAFSFFL